MRKYELLFITRVDYDEEKVSSIIERYKDVVIQGNGTVSVAEKWAKRRLAYEIGDNKEGLYIIILFEGPPSISAELDRLMKIDQDIIRHMISRCDRLVKSIKKEKSRPKKESEEIKVEAGQAKGDVPVLVEETSTDTGEESEKTYPNESQEENANK